MLEVRLAKADDEDRVAVEGQGVVEVRMAVAASAKAEAVVAKAVVADVAAAADGAAKAAARDEGDEVAAGVMVEVDCRG